MCTCPIYIWGGNLSDTHGKIQRKHAKLADQSILKPIRIIVACEVDAKLSEVEGFHLWFQIVGYID